MIKDDLDDKKWDIFEKYEEEYVKLSELPHRVPIKKPVERVIKSKEDET